MSEPLAAEAGRPGASGERIDAPGAGVRPGLQLEIVASLAVVMLAGIAVLGVVVTSFAVQSVEREAVERLRIGVRHLQSVTAGSSSRLADLAVLTRALDRRGVPGAWRVLDAQGRAHGLGRSPTAPLAVPAELLQRASAEGEAVRGGGFPPEDLLLLAPVVTGAGERGWLVGRLPGRELRARLLPLLLAAGWVLVIAAGVFVGFGAWLLRRRIVWPVKRLSGAAARIAAGDLEARVEPSGAGELAALGERFNGMAESLARQRAGLIDTQQSLAHSERLAAVGRLAAGVAHEVGNPLAAILGYAEVALRGTEDGSRAREAVGRMRDESLRIRRLIRDLLDLARPRELETDPHAPRPLLEAVVERLRGQELLCGVRLELEVEADLPPLRVDVRRLEQVLVNLIENAAQALAGQAAPRICLHAHRAHRRDVPARRRGDPLHERHDAQRRADAVAIEVSDNGPGIPEEHLPLVFEPFFTTKTGGTGLGLWNAHRLAELLGGTLQVRSGPEGSRFSLLLPLTDTDATDAEALRADR